jgi:hypothetical protein
MNLENEIYDAALTLNRVNAQMTLNEIERIATFRAILPELRRCIRDCRSRCGVGTEHHVSYYDELLEKLNRCEE